MCRRAVMWMNGNNRLRCSKILCQL
ncbi:MAG TPA: hypothetical protein DEH25_11140 [Chloroflexi bacterium]|nr:hypothetical protein [Chloroflexota bacterium]